MPKKIKILQARYSEKRDEVFWTILLRTGRVITLTFPRKDYGYLININAEISIEDIKKHLPTMTMKEITMDIKDIPDESPFKKELT